MYLELKSIAKDRINIIACSIIVIMFLGLLLIKNSEHIEYIASNSDNEIKLEEDAVLTQTWLTDRKKINGMILKLSQETDTEAIITMELLAGENGEIIRSSSKSLTEREGQSLEFSFDTLNVESLTELVVRVRLKESVDGKGIWVKTNQNYHGLYIDGIDQNCGLGSEIIYIKNSPVFVISVFIGILFIFTICLMILCHRRFEDIIGMALIGIGLYLFVCGMIGNIELGIRTLYVLATAGLIFIIYNLLRNKCNIRDLCSTSMLAIILFYGFIIIYNNNTILTESDEFSHWALAAKDLYHSNQLASHEGTTVMFTRYPPFMSLLQYFFMYINQAFSEKFLFITYQLSGFLLLSIWFRGRKTGILRNMILFLVTVLFPLIFYPRYFNQIMIDGFLGILFAYVLYCFFLDELDTFNIVRITIGLIALVLTKEMGVVLAGIACFIFLLNKIFEKGRRGLREELAILIMGILSLFSFAIWQWYCYLNLHNSTEKSLASATEMVTSGNTIDNGRIQFGIQVILNCISQIWNNVKVGPFPFVVVISLLILFIYIKTNRTKEEKWISSIIMLCLGSFAYFMVLTFLYITVFPEQDALTAASIDRYMFSYLTGIVFLIMGYYINKEVDYERGLKNIGILFCLVLYLASTNDMLTMNQFVEKRQSLIWGYDSIEENFQSFLKKTDKIFFLCDNSTQMSYRIFRFTMCPVEVQSSAEGCTFRYADNQQGAQVTRDIDEIKQVLAKYNYIYIANYDEKALDVYTKLLDESETLQNGGIYRIDLYEYDLKLVQVGYSPIQRFY